VRNDVEASVFWYIESNNQPFNREVSRQQFKEDSRAQLIPSQPNEREAYNTLPLWRPFGHSPGVLGAGNPL
jgi:hypothetical protein